MDESCQQIGEELEFCGYISWHGEGMLYKVSVDHVSAESFEMMLSWWGRILSKGKEAVTCHVADL